MTETRLPFTSNTSISAPAGAVMETDELNGLGWQRSFYDHIIRNETYLAILRDYILKNPEELALEEH